MKQPTFLMCSPDYFNVSYKINPWMNPSKWTAEDADLAMKQWWQLTRKLTHLGCSLEYLEPKPQVPDLVFTANHAVVFDGHVVLANFKHPERQLEEIYVENFFFDFFKKNNGYISNIRRPSYEIFEGAGDADRKSVV